MSLKKQAKSGVKWGSFAAAFNMTTHFFTFVLLAHLLSPVDFGLVAMINVFISFALSYMDIGIGSAIIYKQKITRYQLSSLYWINVCIGVLLFILFMVFSPLIVNLYHEPRIAKLILWSASIFLIIPFGQQFQTLLRKELRFKALAIASMISVLIGFVVAIVFAVMGFGPLSLIWAQLARALFKAVILICLAWRQYKPQFYFNFSEIREYLSFGLFRAGERLIKYFTHRIDQLLIGIFFGAEILGYYNLAFNIVLIPALRVNRILTRAMFPIFSRIQDDKKRIVRAYLLLLRILIFVEAPLLLGILVTAQLFVPIFFGARWLPAIALIQILSIVALLMTIVDASSFVVLARGRPDLGFKWSIVVFFMQFIGVCVGAKLGNVKGVAIALLILECVAFVPSYFVLIRTTIGSCFQQYFYNFLPAFSISVVMAFVVFESRLPIHNPITLLLSKVIVGISVYITLSIVFQKKQLFEIKKLVFS